MQNKNILLAKSFDAFSADNLRSYIACSHSQDISKRWVTAASSFVKTSSSKHDHYKAVRAHAPEK